MATPKSEAAWQAESDARSIADAAAVQADPTRLAAARRAARTMAASEKKRADGAILSARALTKLAGSKPKPKPKPRAAASKPKPKPKR